MRIVKAENSISWAQGITNKIMRLCPIKFMFAVFTDTLQSYAATFFTKTTL